MDRIPEDEEYGPNTEIEEEGNEGVDRSNTSPGDDEEEEIELPLPRLQPSDEVVLDLGPESEDNGLRDIIDVLYRSAGKASSSRPSWSAEEISSSRSYTPHQTLDTLMRREDMPEKVFNAVTGVWIVLRAFVGTSADGDVLVYRGTYVAQDMGVLAAKPVSELFVAVKLLDLADDEDLNRYQDLHWRIRRSRMVPSHANVISIDDPFTSHKGNLFCVPFRDMHYGHLRRKLLVKFPSGMPEDCVVIILKEALKGLSCIHELGLIHGEVCSEHIFLSDEPEVKLAFAATTYDSCMGSRLPIYTRAAAPEIYNPEGKNREYTQAGDIWMIGITALELAYGEQSWITIGERDVLDSLIKGITTKRRLPPKDAIKEDMIPSFFSSFKSKKPIALSRKFGTMVIKCLDADPGKRPSTKELLEMKVLRKCKKNATTVLNYVK